MAVGYHELPPLLPVAGIRWGCTAAGIKKPGRLDLSVMEIAPGSNVAAVFTRNAFCAAPVQVCRRHLQATQPRYLLINTGNANAGTGERGLQDALAGCEALGQQAACKTEQVLPFSTGVIGEYLPMPKILEGLPGALQNLQQDWHQAAHAIMTTDTLPKGVSLQRTIDGHTVTLTGIVKGAGMIRPDMATLLSFIATDATVSQMDLQTLLQDVVEDSFNSVTVDSDTSTNDSLVLVATGQSAAAPIVGGSAAYGEFRQVLLEMCQQLAQLVIRDGEGATKFMTIKVIGGTTKAECKDLAFTVAHSPLVKTAFFASDPNWGRILAAVGRAGISDLDLARVRILLGDVCLVAGGERSPEYTEARGQAVMDQEDITVTIDLQRGAAAATVWTCDFSYDYVRINAEYRT